jgi:hypothetical protein
MSKGEKRLIRGFPYFFSIFSPNVARIHLTLLFPNESIAQSLSIGSGGPSRLTGALFNSNM